MTKRSLMLVLGCAVANLFLLVFPSHSDTNDGTGHPYPRIANYHLPMEIGRESIRYFSGWDLHIFNWYVDRNPESRQALEAIHRLNRQSIFLMYHISIGVNTSLSPPDPLETFAETFDWWLRDYQGYLLTDQYPWEFNLLLNFTNHPSASGSHPRRLRANQYLPYTLIFDHYRKYDFWDGIFYDVFSDNLQWLYLDIKDATSNSIPEFDCSHNQNEPLFDNMWRSGMRTLAQTTMFLDKDAYIVGNGLHRTTLEYLNGRMHEKYRRSTDDLSDLASVFRYRLHTKRDRPLVIVDGVMEDPDFREFSSIRYSLISALLVGAYHSSIVGDCERGEVLWFDEYSIRPDGKVSAVTTTLSQSIGEWEETIPVWSTSGFPDRGVITIDGEQIYYGSKTGSAFEQCMRGYPRCPEAGSYHDAGSTAIHYEDRYRSYLGYPISASFDVNDPTVQLGDLFHRAGWYANDEIAEEINSRIWMRFFGGGAVLLNPTQETVTVNGLARYRLRKFYGIQDPVHNDGQPVNDSIQIGPKDGYILLF